MTWQEVCEHPALRNLPFKIELNETGTILMSPVKVYHSAYQGEIGFLLRSGRIDGRVLTECAITTRQGTKVADVAWVSTQRFAKLKHEIECSVAPEICVEVYSSGNTAKEMQEKKQLYLEQGAQEVWICSQTGTITVYSVIGELEKSLWFPEFPKQIEI